MGYYRVYRYPFKGLESCDKHVFIYRDRAYKVVDRTRKKSGEDRQRMYESLSRTKKVVKEIAFCNQFELFCTFTFRPDGKADRYNWDECRKKLSKLFNHYKDRYSKQFKYLLIPELHKDGAIHFHGLLAGIRPGNLIKPANVQARDLFTGEIKTISNVHGYMDWPYYSEKMGFFSCSKIVNQFAVSCYVTKYITKDLMQLPANANLYMASKGLKRAELVFDMDDLPMQGRPDFRNDFVKIQWHGAEYLESEMGCIDALEDAQLVPEDLEPEYIQIRMGAAGGLV